VIRHAYVAAIRGTVSVLERTGADKWLSSRQSPMARHVWSLSAIYDIERMVSLDLPWWTYQAAEEVDRFLSSKVGGARVFEFGSGASTLWLAKRAREVHSVEHDEGFVGLVRNMLGSRDNVDLRGVVPTELLPTSTAVSERAGHEHLDFEDYVSVIDDVGGLFDLIVIDGRARSACLERAIPHLVAGGVIVFDNAGRNRYRAAIDASGLVVEMKAGWAPSLPYREATALLRHPS
jgi:Methyltransferase domain